MDGEVKMTLSDLDKLIRLESFLRDEPDSRQEIVVADLRTKSNEELREMIRQEMETLKELEAKEEIPVRRSRELGDRATALLFLHFFLHFHCITPATMRKNTRLCANVVSP